MTEPEYEQYLATIDRMMDVDPEAMAEFRREQMRMPPEEE